MKEKKCIILGLLVAVALLLITGCDMGVTYAIGDTGPSGVGIVFYITDGGLHGLEVAPSDQSTSQVWIEGGSTQITQNGNTGTGIGTGLANSYAIIAQSGHTGSAAQVCRVYNGGGLTDWYLPSKDELNAIWDNLVNDGTGALQQIFQPLHKNEIRAVFGSRPAVSISDPVHRPGRAGADGCLRKKRPDGF